MEGLSGDCGSITGAPKIKTMGLIKKLEPQLRGIYTGAIGFISPDKEACFNVAIRTLELDGKRCQVGVGGGIVYDSKEKEEYKVIIPTNNKKQYSLCSSRRRHNG